MADRIKAGLRATLQTESLVTGVLYVGVDKDPNAPTPVLQQVEPLYPELPSEPTKTQQLFNNLASLDIKSLQTNLNGLLTQLRTTVQELKMAEINAGATNLLSSVNRLVTDPDITNALAALRPTLDQYRELGAKVTGKVDPLAGVCRKVVQLVRIDWTVHKLQGAPPQHDDWGAGTLGRVLADDGAAGGVPSARCSPGWTADMPERTRCGGWRSKGWVTWSR